MADAFISYTRKDKAFATALKARLEADGFEILFDLEDIVSVILARLNSRAPRISTRGAARHDGPRTSNSTCWTSHRMCLAGRPSAGQTATARRRPDPSARSARCGTDARAGTARDAGCYNDGHSVT